jgi:hypothetical protein
LKWKAGKTGLGELARTAGVAFLGVFYALKADGYGPRRALVGLFAAAWGLSSAWRLWGELPPADPDQPRSVVKEFLVACLLAVLLVFLSLPIALLAMDPLDHLVWVEWAGFLLVGIGVAGQFAPDSMRRFFAWLIWLAWFVAALSTPFGAWTILCPLAMLTALRRPPRSSDQPSPDEAAP